LLIYVMDPLDPNERLRALFAKGEQVDIDYGVPARRYFRSCQELMRMAGVYYDEKNFENSYILYAKFIVLSFEKLKNHPDYSNVPAGERSANKKALMIAFDRAEKLKPLLKKKYQEAYTKHLEEQALMVALAREEEVRKKEEEVRMAQEEEKKKQEIEEKRRQSEIAMMDAFLLAQEQKKLEKERQAIEAEFAPKVTIDDNKKKKKDETLIPIDIAPPPITPHIPNVPPPSISQTPSHLPSSSSTSLKYQPTIPSRVNKPISTTVFPQIPSAPTIPILTTPAAGMYFYSRLPNLFCL